YRPSAEEEQFARELLAAAQHEGGVFTFRGKMVDGPILRHAEQTLRRAGHKG
ncbi:MAG: CoA ester lyase, partial [Actinomycetes bacterium]